MDEDTRDEPIDAFTLLFGEAADPEALWCDEDAVLGLIPTDDEQEEG